MLVVRPKKNCTNIGLAFLPLLIMTDNGNSDSDECFLAFTKIFSGVLHAGHKFFVLITLYDSLKQFNYYDVQTTSSCTHNTYTYYSLIKNMGGKSRERSLTEKNKMIT